jgi:3'(2'),5'-bisphosphate nucleotidase
MPDLERTVLPADLKKTDLKALVEALAEIAVSAGVVVMDAYGRARVRRKDDTSPVTDADLASEAFILSALDKTLPRVPVLAEEQAAAGRLPPDGATFVAVDPLDGTREFLELTSEFTINIGVVIDGRPAAGVVYAPALQRLWLAAAEAEVMLVGPGAPLREAKFRHRIRTRTPPPDGLTALTSRSHPDQETLDYLSRLPVARRQSAGSSTKFCLIAEGIADVYPRFGPTMEWDTAAAHAVLAAAGGAVVSPDGRPLTYGKRDRGFRNGPFIAWGRLPS